MSDTRLSALEAQLAAVLKDLDRLKAVEAVRDAVMRFARGLDRMDHALMASAFHADATVDLGAIFVGPVAQFLDVTMVHQARQRDVQHMVGNMLVRVDGAHATAESYELARHKSPVNGEMVDLVLAMRTLDRFERRGGEWRIVHRRKLVDWARALQGQDLVLEKSPLARGVRDANDPSYALFNQLPQPAATEEKMDGAQTC